MAHSLLQSAFGTGLSRPQKFTAGFKFAKEGTLLDAPFLAYELATAQRGEVAPTLISRTAGWGTYVLIAGALSVAVPGVGPIASALLATYPNSLVENGINRGIRSFSQLNRRIRRLEMGGSFEDSQTAQALRMRAVTEMNAALLPARRYLGSEAQYFHR